MGGEGNILIIDDEEVICDFLRDLLKDREYSVTTEQSGEKGLEVAEKEGFDVVIVDLRMPGMDGIEVLEGLKKHDPDSIVIVITAYGSLESAQQALRLGAYDYITKPFNVEQISFAVKRAVTSRRLIIANRRLMKDLEKQTLLLERKVEERTKELTSTHKELQEVYMRTITALASAVDAKDHYTRSHSEHVTKYAVAIAKEMRLAPSEIELIREACQLHDLGKIGIHDYILTKPGKLTPEEWDEIRLHSLRGAEILKPLTFLNGVIELIRQHHERYDGKGYPYGYKGKKIELGARIIAAADAYDAMISERPYRKAYSKEGAIKELKRNSGTQFDPKVIKAFLKVLKKEEGGMVNAG